MVNNKKKILVVYLLKSPLVCTNKSKIIIIIFYIKYFIYYLYFLGLLHLRARNSSESISRRKMKTIRVRPSPLNFRLKVLLKIWVKNKKITIIVIVREKYIIWKIRWIIREWRFYNSSKGSTYWRRGWSIRR